MQIATFVIENEPVADIGSDHALLPCYLVLNGIVSRAIAVEVNCGPFEAARRQVERFGLKGQIDVRLGDGLTVLQAGEVATVVIAGMGGSLIHDILEKGSSVLKRTKRLVLQPNVSALTLRQWMLQRGWRLIQEELVLENGRFYDILVAEQGDAYVPYQEMDPVDDAFLLEIGPWLWRKRHPLLREKWEQEIGKWENVLKALEQSRHATAEKKRRQLELKIHKWKERIACLPKGNTSSAYSNQSCPLI